MVPVIARGVVFDTCKVESANAKMDGRFGAVPSTAYYAGQDDACDNTHTDVRYCLPLRWLRCSLAVDLATT
jgi:hypothetical protein